MRRATLATGLIFSLCAASAAQDQPTQPASQPPTQPPPATQPAAPADLEKLHPAQRLGLRAEGVRRKIAVIPVVVLAPDAGSYIDAIGAWTVEARFPVLFDDGTPRAVEDIARFVRAFKPERIVRFRSGTAWPPDDEGRKALIEGALARSWGAEGPGGLGPRWEQLKFAPYGLVVSGTADPAWTAALALAAGHGQPMAWITAVGPEGDISQELSAASGESICGAIEQACERTGLAWKDLGDSLDAVTLCLNLPTKVVAGADSRIALTDLVGRREAAPGAGRTTGSRWAWTGQVFGNEAAASYRAMCALFIQPRDAWLFDGYPDTEPWSQWDATKGAEVLTQVGLSPALDDAARGAGIGQWRLRASLPMRAGLILVNTQGNADFFDLAPGRGRPGDVPILGEPAAVHFVHSWSAAWPGGRDTIAGRWMERGAFAYAGSMQEPYLQAFMPTPAVAARLGSAFPWGAAVRLDGGPAWRINVFGDPLFTLGPGAPRSAAALPLDGVSALTAELAAALEKKDYAAGVATLTLLGRDADVARLAHGLMKDDPRAFTSDLAAACVLPIFRAPPSPDGPSRAETLVEVFQYLTTVDAARPGLRDALWLANGPGLAAKRNERLLSTLSINLRPGQIGADAAALASALRALHGRAAAENLLLDARAQTEHHTDISAIEEAIRALGGG